MNQKSCTCEVMKLWIFVHHIETLWVSYFYGMLVLLDICHYHVCVVPCPNHHPYIHHQLRPPQLKRTTIELKWWEILTILASISCEMVRIFFFFSKSITIESHQIVYYYRICVVRGLCFFFIFYSQTLCLAMDSVFINIYSQQYEIYLRIFPKFKHL